MKKGYTLAEALIALGIIGVIAAVLLPLINRVRPDDVKVNYLKTYRAISATAKQMVSNSKLFPACQNIGGADICFNKNALFNKTRGVNNQLGEEYNNASKICRLLADSFNAQGENNCSETYSEFNDVPDAQFSFALPDGKQFYVSTNNTLVNAAEKKYNAYTEIVFDVNGNKAPNCLYGPNCTTPDRFKLFLRADGDVKVGDAMGEAYLADSKNWLKKEHQIGENPAKDEYTITLSSIIDENAGDDETVDNEDTEIIVAEEDDIVVDEDEDLPKDGYYVIFEWTKTNANSKVYVGKIVDTNIDNAEIGYNTPYQVYTYFRNPNYTGNFCPWNNYTKVCNGIRWTFLIDDSYSNFETGTSGEFKIWNRTHAFCYHNTQGLTPDWKQYCTTFDYAYDHPNGGLTNGKNHALSAIYGAMPSSYSDNPPYYHGGFYDILKIDLYLVDLKDNKPISSTKAVTWKCTIDKDFSCSDTAKYNGKEFKFILRKMKISNWNDPIATFDPTAYRAEGSYKSYYESEYNKLFGTSN